MTLSIHWEEKVADMTEQEWITSTDPAAMLQHFVASGRHVQSGETRTYCAISPRKLRLFACACCRQVWHLLTDERSRRAVEIAELFADGLAGGDDLTAAFLSVQAELVNANCPYAWNARATCFEVAQNAATEQLRSPSGLPALVQADLLRDMIQPFAPLVLPREQRKCERCEGDGYERWPNDDGIGGEPCPDCKSSGTIPGDCPWLTPTVLALAANAYELRVAGYTWIATRPECIEGCLDNDRLAILADALEDAGCTDERLLMPLRGMEWCPCTAVPEHSCWLPRTLPFYRGNYALDLLLGLS